MLSTCHNIKSSKEIRSFLFISFTHVQNLKMDTRKIGRFISSNMSVTDHHYEIIAYNQYRLKKKWRRLFYVGISAPTMAHHVFRVKPKVYTRMVCRREPHNRYDRNAVKIYDRYNTAVGMMPRDMARIVAGLLDNGTIIHASVLYVGHRHFGSIGDFGDGAKLRCLYFFEFRELNDRNRLVDMLLEEYDSTRLMKFP